MPAPDFLQRLQRTLGDGFVVERELARGGMSRVYLAKDKSLGRDVVVKALSPELAAEVNIERFSREIRMAGRLQHPHIVPLLSAGDADGTPFFVMPFVEGRSLREKLIKGGELPIHETIRILRDVANALEYAHQNGIVHRDVKPENILLSSGNALVTDFGVAKAISSATEGDGRSNLTSVGVALGTPTYMAPEQASADPTTDHRADIYAWGAVAYEMLTGAPPFAGRGTQAIIAAHMSEAVPPIHRTAVPARLSGVVMRALAKRPADRPQSANELVMELDGMMATGITSSRETSAPRSTAPAVRFGLAIGALMLAGAALFFFRPRDENRVGGGTDAVRRIAVLPFENASGTKDDEYFADGMSDELGAALGRVRGVRVASHSSAFSFKGKVVDVREVGRKLNVDAILEGRVRRAGSRLRVTAELTDVRNGLSLWSDSYERESKDVFAVQDDIAHSIANALEVRFLPRSGSSRTAETQGTADPEAYDLFLRARYFWHKRGSGNLRKAVDLFAGAAARDPKFARAYAGLASSRVLLTEYADDAPKNTDDLALAAAEQALALDPTVSEAFMARGLVDVHRWKWQEAREAYQKAIQLDATSATARQWYGELFYTLGEVDSSIVESRIAKALDPLAPVPATALAYALYGGRHYAESVAEAQRARELAPDLGLIPRILAVDYVLLGDTARAMSEAKRVVSLEPGQSRALSILAYVAGRVGHRTEALAALATLKAEGAPPMALGLAYLGLGNLEAARAALKTVGETRDRRISEYPLIDPVFDPVRASPEFRRVAGMLGSPKVLVSPPAVY